MIVFSKVLMTLLLFFVAWIFCQTPRCSCKPSPRQWCIFYYPCYPPYIYYYSSVFILWGKFQFIIDNWSWTVLLVIKKRLGHYIMYKLSIRKMALNNKNNRIRKCDISAPPLKYQGKHLLKCLYSFLFHRQCHYYCHYYHGHCYFTEHKLDGEYFFPFLIAWRSKSITCF